MSDFFIYSTYIRCHYPRHPRLRCFHLQDIRSLQGGEQHRTIIINDKTKYIPWGGDNQMPYKISALTILQYINFINNKPIGRIKYALN